MGPYNINDAGPGGGGGSGVPVGSFAFFPASTSIEYETDGQYFLRTGWLQKNTAKFDSAVWKSSIGADWSSISKILLEYYSFAVDAESNGNTIIVLLQTGGGTNKSMARSMDNGLTWTLQTSGLANFETDLRFWNGIDYGAGRWVLVGYGGRIAVSSDGVNWTDRPSNTGAFLQSVKWNGSMFVAVGVGVILTSPDGLVWTSRAVPSGLSGHHFQSVAFGNNAWVVVGGSGACMSAPADGIVWTQRGINLPSAANAVLFDGPTASFFILGNGVVNKSPDGITWTLIREGLSHQHGYGRSFARVGDHFCFTTNTAVHRSLDMINVTSVQAVPPTTQLNWCKKLRNGSAFAFELQTNPSAVVVFKANVDVFAGFNTLITNLGMIAYVRIS